MPPPKTYGLTHIALAVRDLERTLAFYARVFDMDVMYRGADFLQLTTPGTHDILVFEKKEEAAFGQTGGIAHFGFRLILATDIDEMAACITSAGGQITERGEFVPGEPYIFFTDPDGYLVEVWFELSS